MGSSMHVSELVQVNAISKAETVAAGHGHSVVIGADTLVVHGGDIIGKPQDEGEAREMLEKFSNSRIEVYTGLCIIRPDADRKAVGFEKSSIFTATLDKNRIERCFKLLAPYDKAGGFSIEGVGAMIFDNIEGSYFNILGLPMMKLSLLFSQVGLDILDYISKS